MRVTSRRSWAGLAAALVIVLPGAARGQEASPAPPDEAAGRNRAGVALVDKGEFVRAIEEFREAYRLRPDPKYLFNIGRCYDLLSRPREAIDYYRRYLDAAPGAPDRATVKSYVARAGAILGTTMAEVTVAAEPADASVFVDGDASACRAGVPCWVLPGARAIRVTRPGFDPVEQVETVRAGESVRVAVRLSATPRPAPPADAAAPAAATAPVAVKAPAPRPAPRATALWTGLRWGLLGAGAAVVATGGALHGVAVKGANDATDAYVRGGPYGAYDAAYGTAEGRLKGAWACYAIGGALLAADLVFWLVAPPPGKPSASPGEGPALTLRPAGLGIGGAW
ncbi:MAG: tetratricopeptide repeat protein [Deltaproteobacteria bacterium]|nr:tetratricopeptide repeat protein [Deltaproteobacteria bacterium]